jgi:hypothetical protein
MCRPFLRKKIPAQCKKQRNCQLGVVAASIIITLGTSFSPNVDWGAHFGGALQGVLWGIILLGSELDNFRNKVRHLFSSSLLCFAID